jgi:release factor glutamine methyltransferase
VDAWYLLEYVTGVGRTKFLMEPELPLSLEHCERYEELLRLRGSHIPLQHLTGEQEFMGLAFRVNEHVLIPRQDTELLVEEAMKVIRSGMHILDLCTGSGCIAVSLAKLCPQITADGADLSEEALAVAEENGRIHGVSINWIRSDLFEKIEKQYVVIVSNPPYIRPDVIETLEEEVRLHEPYQALCGREDGLYFYREIVRESRNHLKADGWLLFEIGYDQGEAVSRLLETSGFQNVKIVKDLAGLDRVVEGRLLPEE